MPKKINGKSKKIMSFEAENDAFMLSEVEQLKADKPRMARARKAADKMAKDRTRQAKQLKKVSKKK